MNDEISKINIALVGESKSGKSSLIKCFLFNKIEESNDQTILNITNAKIKIINKTINVNFIEMSSDLERDKGFLMEYMKNIDIFLLCYTFDTEISSMVDAWIKFIGETSNNSIIYLIGCKYDLKVLNDYLKDEKKITTIKFDNENLSQFGLNILNIINSKGKLKGYYICSSILKFNVKELFNEIIKDYLYNAIYGRTDKKKDNQNCILI